MFSVHKTAMGVAVGGILPPFLFLEQIIALGRHHTAPSYFPSVAHGGDNCTSASEAPPYTFLRVLWGRELFNQFLND